jgi:hypothetical protein
VEIRDDDDLECSNNNDCRGASSSAKSQGHSSRPRTFPAPHERQNDAQYTRDTKSDTDGSEEEKEEERGRGGGEKGEVNVEQKEKVAVGDEKRGEGEEGSGVSDEQHPAAVRRSLDFSGQLRSPSEGDRKSSPRVSHGDIRSPRSSPRSSDLRSTHANTAKENWEKVKNHVAGAGAGRHGNHGDRSTRYSQDGLVRQEAVEKVRKAKENWEKKMALRKRQQEEAEEQEYLRLSTLGD